MKFVVKPEKPWDRNPITLCWLCSEDPRACIYM